MQIPVRKVMSWQEGTSQRIESAFFPVPAEDFLFCDILVKVYFYIRRLSSIIIGDRGKFWRSSDPWLDYTLGFRNRNPMPLQSYIPCPGVFNKDTFSEIYACFLQVAQLGNHFWGEIC